MIERNGAPGLDPCAEEMVQFLFSAASAGTLLQRARALLDTAPKELSDSFEQAVRRAGFAS